MYTCTCILYNGRSRGGPAAPAGVGRARERMDGGIRADKDAAGRPGGGEGEAGLEGAGAVLHARKRSAGVSGSAG